MTNPSSFHLNSIPSTFVGYIPPFLLLLLLVLVIVVVAFFYTCLYKPVKFMFYYSYQNIQGTTYRPLVGDLPLLIRNRQKHVPFDEWFLQYDNQFGKLYYMFLGPEFRLRIANPQIIQQILIKYSSSFQKPQLMRNVLGLMLGNGLLLSEGNIHKHHRLLINPAFQFNKLKSMTPLMLTAAQKHIVQLWLSSKTTVVTKEQPRTMDIHEALSALTLEIISQAAFGTYTTVDEKKTKIGPSVDSHKMYESLAFLLTSMISNVQNLGAFIPGYLSLPLPRNRKIQKEVKNIRLLLTEIIKERKNKRIPSSEAHTDLLIDQLLDAQSAATTTPFTDEDILNEAITFIMAGHETTSQALSWVLYCLAKNPEWKTQLVNQINDLLPSKQVPSYEDVNKLPLLSSIIWETMRLFPPAPIVAREAIANVDIEYTSSTEVNEEGKNNNNNNNNNNRPNTTVTKHLNICKGTALVVSVASLHRDPDFWFDPHNFHPERWANGYSQTLRHPCAYIPFSMGDRNCIGERFALQEAKLILIILLQHMDFELDSSYIHFPTMAITLRPGCGMPMRIWPRTELV